MPKTFKATVYYHWYQGYGKKRVWYYVDLFDSKRHQIDEMWDYENKVIEKEILKDMGLDPETSYEAEIVVQYSTHSLHRMIFQRPSINEEDQQWHQNLKTSKAIEGVAHVQLSRRGIIGFGWNTLIENLQNLNAIT